MVKAISKMLKNLKSIVMRKIFLFLVIAGLLNGCYDDYRLDYPHTTVAFSNATGGATTPNTLHRTVVMGEGLKLDAGIYLAGVRENKEERWVDFVIDESILQDTPYEAMPAEYYSLSNDSRFIIPAGDWVGRVTVTLDSTLFVNDVKATDYHYAIPIRLTQTSADSILSTQGYQILAIKYIHRNEGYYEHEGSFVTKDADGTILNEGEISNALLLSTIMHDTLMTNGMISARGVDFMMTLHAGNEIFMEYFPNPDPVEPENIALGATPSTDYVSPWESLASINSGTTDPVSSTERPPGGIYGNWWSAGMWRYVQYDFDSYYMIDESKVYWFTDGGGLLIPDSTYVEYWDIEEEVWVETWRNWDGSGVERDTWNTLTIDPPVITDKIRMYFKSNTESCGIIEWQVWGIPAAVGLEQQPIEMVTAIGENSFDEETYTFNLNYRVDFLLDDYYTEVSATLKWRNRIRDGVNEWRR